MGSMLRRFSRIATYAIVLSCCFVPYSCKKTTDYLNGHEYVDLGLSVKWATCNVGASAPEDYGNYYAWGEIAPKDKYTKENSATWEKDMGDIAGIPNYDAACANWGDTWRMPTEAEIEELINKCRWTWATQGGHNGYRITGPNGNSIFLPAAGGHSESLFNDGEYGYYWSSSPYEEDDTHNAYSLGYYSVDFAWNLDYRYYGHSVRPVTE